MMCIVVPPNWIRQDQTTPAKCPKAFRVEPRQLKSQPDHDIALQSNPCRDRQCCVQPSPRRVGATRGECEWFQHAPPKLPADADMLAAPHRHLRRAILLDGLLPTSSSHRAAPNRRGESACSPLSRIYLWPPCATWSDQPRGRSSKAPRAIHSSRLLR